MGRACLKNHSVYCIMPFLRALIESTDENNNKSTRNFVRPTRVVDITDTVINITTMVCIIRLVRDTMYLIIIIILMHFGKRLGERTPRVAKKKLSRRRFRSVMTDDD